MPTLRDINTLDSDCFFNLLEQITEAIFLMQVSVQTFNNLTVVLRHGERQ